MRTQLYDLLEDLTNMFTNTNTYRDFPLDVFKTEEGFEVVAEIPGFKKEDIKIEFEDGTLVIEASQAQKAEETKKEEKKETKYLVKERFNTKLHREVYFGDINEDSINAKYENGLLIVNVIVKKEEEKVKKNIVIE